MPSSHKYSLASCFLDVHRGIKAIRLLCLGRQKQLEERAGPAQASGYSNSPVGRDRAPPCTTSSIPRSRAVAPRAALTGSPRRSRSCWRMSRSRQRRKRTVQILATPPHTTWAAVALPNSWDRLIRSARRGAAGKNNPGETGATKAGKIPRIRTLPSVSQKLVKSFHLFPCQHLSRSPSLG